MTFPEELKYSRNDEWVKMLDATTALVGITDYAQNEMGGLVFINLPVAGDTVTKGEALCDIESVKAVSDVISPVTEKLNEDPYGAWIAKVENISDQEALMNAAEYRTYRGV